MEKQTDIIIAGFFRTGNTFLETCITSLYKNINCISKHDHSVKYLFKQLEKENHIITTIRNPVDTVASFHEFKKFLNSSNNYGTIEMDIKFYTRYMNYINDNFEKILCLDFDIFTKDINYISDSVNKKFKILKTNDVDIELINEYMERNKEIFFNKRNSYLPNNEIKKYISNTEEIFEAQNVYNTLKLKMEEYNG